MQEINWPQFSAKFNGREDKVFEWFCYLLFCIEYHQSLGITRYKNQPGIETDPIKVDDDWIGWQSKFFTTKLSENVKEFTDSIDTTKKLYPHITKLVFYTNQEFSLDKKKATSSPKETIETYAASKGISIIWKTASSFEDPFVTRDNAVLAKYFFSANRSVFDLIAELNQHSEAILGPIHSTIAFNGELKIDRTEDTTALTNALLRSSLPLVLSGDGGVGKTALIKDFYATSSQDMPLFVFKATEFNNLTHINNLFKSYGDFNAIDFAAAYPDVDKKCIVIDSAEKLSDIEDKDVFREFLKLALQNKWQIIFTTRRSYMDYLKVMLVDSFDLEFQSIDISELSLEELEALAKKHSFDLPSNSRMVDLIRNPFYLNEYLKSYGTFSKDVTYSDFKKLLWNKHIADISVKTDNIHIKREDSFIELARRRADQGSFSVDASGIDDQALGKLLSAELIGYDENLRQYFITHDIYEEWALDRIVDTTFHRSKDGKTSDFFSELGESLPIRRAFRNWLSDKLAVDKNEVKTLIENSISDQDIPGFWRDEVLISVLLSDHAQSFFDLFEKELLTNDGKLLVRITFLLRIACKSIDEIILRRFGLRAFQREYAIQGLFTAPKGSGWAYLIKFIDDHKKTLGLNNMGAIVALLTDWNTKNTTSETTKHASTIALFYYNELADKDALGYGRHDFESKLIKVILSGSSEIKEELTAIIDQIISNSTYGHRSRYYSLAEAMLSSVLESTEVAKAIPLKIIQLAEYFWMMPKGPGSSGYPGVHDMEGYFGITTGHQDYYPPSALQTPIGVLLQIATQETIDFIIKFTNKATEAYAQSELSTNEAHVIKIHISDKKTIPQLASHRLWELYRGSEAASSVLQSIHIALEKWLIDYAKKAPQEEIEKLCIYLLENSKSVSITAIVVSAVISEPYKLFRVADILFRTKEVFSYDKSRYVQDQTRKGDLEALRDNFPQRDFMTKMHQNERITSADDKHRKNELENIVVSYQFFQPEGVTADEVSAIQKEIWKILDEYYKALPNAAKETESDKVWRLCLARMDRRKMHPTTEKKDGQTLLSFNPQIDPDLKRFSDEALKKNGESQKHIPLKLWANYRWKKQADKYKPYDQYEKDHTQVIAETKEIIAKLKKGDKNTQTFDSATPIYACAVLIRDFADKLNEKEKQWCKDVIFSYASRPIDGSYNNAFIDGVDAAIGALPFLYGLSNKDDETIKTYLLLTLFNKEPVGAGQSISDLSLVTILHNLWRTNPEAAQSIMLGYISLKPKYDQLREELRKEGAKKQIYQITEEQVLKELDKRHEKEIGAVLHNTIKYADVAADIQNIDMGALETAFELIPYETKNKDHRAFLSVALPRLAERIFDDEQRFEDTHKLLEKLSHFILSSKVEDINEYLQPFVGSFSVTRGASDLIEAFLSAADKLDRYEEFWTVWNLLYDPVINVSKLSGGRSDVKAIIHNYLLAWQYWKETAREWHMLKDREKAFYKKASREIEKPVTVLYALAKILYDIGSSFTDDGIVWVSDLLEENPNLASEDLEVNTVYHLEHVLRRYIFSNRHKIKSSPALKKRVIAILDLLIEQASVAAYIMREDIL